jgi:hypothetical protein
VIINVNDHREGQRIITRPGVRARRFAVDFPGWDHPAYKAWLLDIPAELPGTVIGVNSHGTAPFTRYDVLFDDGTSASDLDAGEDFTWAPPITRAEITAAAAAMRRAFKISPAMEQGMVEALNLRGEARPPVVAGRHTERALIRRDLAMPVRGRTEVPAYRYTGVLGRTTTVHDAHLGARLTVHGAHVARMLRADRTPPGDLAGSWPFDPR